MRPSGRSRPSISAKCGRTLKRRHRSRHRAKRRAADVEEVDFLDAGEDDRDAERLGEDDFAERFARGRRENLRIVEPLGQIVGIENDRGHADRPGQRAAPDLIDAGDPSMAVGERLALEVEMGRGHEGTRRRSDLFLHRSSRRSPRIAPFVRRQAIAAAAGEPRWERKCRWKETRFAAASAKARIGYRGRMETPDPLLERVSPALAAVPGVVAVALGGSRATGAAHAASDYDIGLYFSERAGLDVKRLLEAAKGLVDDPAAAQVTEVGGWGPWIVGGGWLTIAGKKVDLLYRPIESVERVISDCREGRVSMDYQPGHPHGFCSAIWMGEVALCRRAQRLLKALSRL